MLLIAVLINMVLSSATAQVSFEVLDDGTQPKMSRWTVEGPVKPDIGVDYIGNDKERGYVISLKGFGLNNMFTYKGDKGQPLNIKAYKAIQWKMKYERPFIVQVQVSTNQGTKYLLYSDLTNKINNDDTYLHTGIGSRYRDGNWRVVTRDIEQDLASFLPKAKLLSIDAVSFRGTGYIDDIWALSSVPQDVALSKGDVKGWDKIGKSGKISTDFDRTLGKVIKFDSGKNNGDFRLRSIDGKYWKAGTNVILQLKIKTESPYKIFVIGNTLNGKYILSYDDKDVNEPYSKEKVIINYGLGANTKDGKWHVITRDLEQDIKKIDPKVDVSSVGSILVRGVGRITDIKLLARSPLEATDTKGWDVLENEFKGATAKVINDTEKGNVIETAGNGLLNGYKYTGEHGSMGSDDKPFVEWDMKFSEPFDLVFMIQTDTVGRYIHYVPKPVSSIEQKEGDLYIGVGETATDNRWHTINRNLAEDLKLINKDAKYVSCKEVLLKGSGRVGKIEFSAEDLSSSNSSSASAVASLVIGQFDFVHNLKNLWEVDKPSPNGLNNPSGVIVDKKGNVYVSDTGNNRILIWNRIPKHGGTPADIVLSSQDLKRPTGLYVTDKFLFVADTDNDRVLIFDLPINENSKSITAIEGLKDPRGVFSDGTRFFVADTGNNRVLIWNEIPKENKTPFDVVLGQFSVKRGESNKGRAKPNYNTLYLPSSVYSDGTSLYIADSGNSRIVVFKQIPTMNGWHADLVIGQNDFTSGEANRGARVSSAVSLNQPRSLTISEATLFVSDSKNNRVLIYERSGEEMSFSEADGVIGQPGFKTSNINGPKAIPGASTLFLPEAVFVKDGVVLVADSLNNRVLIY